LNCRQARRDYEQKRIDRQNVAQADVHAGLRGGKQDDQHRKQEKDRFPRAEAIAILMEQQSRRDQQHAAERGLDQIRNQIVIPPALGGIPS
jgi:hypothetical protein